MDFGRALFGPIGGTIFAFMVAFSCFGALNGILSRLYPARIKKTNDYVAQDRFSPPHDLFMLLVEKDISLRCLGDCTKLVKRR
jgi:hypothetical protein